MLNLKVEVPENSFLPKFWEDSVHKDPTFESLFPFPPESKLKALGFEWFTPYAYRLSKLYSNIQKMQPVEIDVIVALAMAQEEAWKKDLTLIVCVGSFIRNTTDAFLGSVGENYFVVRGKDELNHLVQVEWDNSFQDEKTWLFTLADHTNDEYEEQTCARFYTFEK